MEERATVLQQELCELQNKLGKVVGIHEALTARIAHLKHLHTLAVETAHALRIERSRSIAKMSLLTESGQLAISRGLEWKALAESLQLQHADLTVKYELACEALELMAIRYKTDLPRITFLPN